MILIVEELFVTSKTKKLKFEIITMSIILYNIINNKNTMGLVYTCLDIVASSAKMETTETRHADGTVVIESKKNPIVAGITIAGVLTFLIFYTDAGNGFLSKIVSSKFPITNTVLIK